MAHVLIVGKSFSGLKNFLIDQGHTYTVLQDSAATKFPEKKFKRRVVTSFKDPSSYLAAVDAIQREKPIDAALTIYENYIVACAHITTHLGLPGLTAEAAVACTDKEIMRAKFSTAPEKISPGFMAVHSREDLQAFAASHQFPLILKPANLAKSLLVTKNDTLEELLANYDKALGLLDSTYKKYAPNNTPKLLVEEFLEGSVHSVDAFIDATGEPHVLENVVDYQTGYDIGYDDNFHYSRLLPSRLPGETIAAIRHCANVGCQALGMTSSPAHVEIILTADGPRIVEIGARNGGYRERMHRLANAIDIPANALALALNQPLDIAPKKNDSVGVFELFPKMPGIFSGLTNEATLRALPSLNYLSIKATPGHFVGKAGDGYKMCAVVILHNSDETVFAQDRETLAAQIAVLTARE